MTEQVEPHGRPTRMRLVALSRRGRRLAMAITAATATAAVATPVAHGAGDPTALGIRAGDHAAYVRVVVDFTAGALPSPSEMLMATDPDPLADGTVRLQLDRRRIHAAAAPARLHGLTVVV